MNTAFTSKCNNYIFYSFPDKFPCCTYPFLLISGVGSRKNSYFSFIRFNKINSIPQAFRYIPPSRCRIKNNRLSLLYCQFLNILNNFQWYFQLHDNNITSADQLPVFTDQLFIYLSVCSRYDDNSVISIIVHRNISLSCRNLLQFLHM